MTDFINTLLASSPGLSTLKKRMDKHGVKGESFMDVLDRVFTHYEQTYKPPAAEQPKPVETPVPNTQPAAPVQAVQPAQDPQVPPTNGPTDQVLVQPIYKFKTWDRMNKDMTENHSPQWQSAMSILPDQLHKILGVVPSDKETQDKMHAVFIALPGTSNMGFVIMDNKTIPFNKNMIEIAS